jgi:hypothetical protein
VQPALSAHKAILAIPGLMEIVAQLADQDHKETLDYKATLDHKGLLAKPGQ